MNLFVIQNGLIHKLPRFEVDFGCSKIKPKLNDKDVMIASIYQILYLLVVKVDSTGMIRQINMYEIPSDISKPLQLAHVLLLHVDDNVGLHVIDNLVIVHHRTEANSYIFDIKVSDPSTTDHLPVLISPINVVNELSTSYGSETIFETYPWKPIASKFVWKSFLLVFFDDVKGVTAKFLRFIMNRTKAEEFMLTVIHDEILSKSLSLFKIANIFREIYDPNEKQVAVEILQRNDYSKCKIFSESYSPMKADQSHILTYIFEPLGRHLNIDKRWLSNVLLEFMLILKQHKSLIHNYLPELLIMVMSEAKEYGRLQQILQHRVIDDSKFLAFRLIEISKTYPPFFQLAIDMLARRGNNEHILNLLLERGQVVDAVKLIKDPSTVDQALCLKILDTAWKSDNRQTKYTIYSYFHDVLKLEFMDSSNEQFEKYSKDFKALFDSEEIEEAEDRFRLARISSTPVSINSMLTQESSFEGHHSFSSFRE
uniref:Mic1 domain-containing protein n=1 Tax=Panagrolaimus davidi TaxID=227884 RepID=A0A914R0L4_9BILA